MASGALAVGVCPSGIREQTARGGGQTGCEKVAGRSKRDGRKISLIIKAIIRRTPRRHSESGQSVGSQGREDRSPIPTTFAFKTTITGSAVGSSRPRVASRARRQDLSAINPPIASRLIEALGGQARQMRGGLLPLRFIGDGLSV